MKKTIAVTSLLTLVTAGSALASGYRIPEQSVNSTARAGSYTAHTPGADSAYYNPANMAWLPDTAHFEADLVYINLKAVSYTDARTPYYNGESETENFLLPTLYAVSPDHYNFRFGLSLTYPGGLSKQWEQPYPRTFAEEFSLKVVEFSPAVAYRFNEMFSIAAGVRAVYADGTVKSAGMIAPGVTASRDMDGDTWEAGYNLAFSARPVQGLNLGVTYRSKVDLDLEGSSTLQTSAGPGLYSGDGSVSVPLPAVLSLGVAYTFFDQLTVELQWDRTYWSDYENIDFNYPVSLGNPVLTSLFDLPKAKNWEDTDSWRIGVSYDLNQALTLMAGFAIDENPVPDSSLGFDLPDSDAKLYSLGVRYRLNEHLELGMAYLYDDKEDRTVNNSIVSGRFEDSGAHLITFGLNYKL